MEQVLNNADVFSTWNRERIWRLNEPLQENEEEHFFMSYLYSRISGQSLRDFSRKCLTTNSVVEEVITRIMSKFGLGFEEWGDPSGERDYCKAHASVRLALRLADQMKFGKLTHRKISIRDNYSSLLPMRYTRLVGEVFENTEVKLLGKNLFLGHLYPIFCELSHASEPIAVFSRTPIPLNEAICVKGMIFREWNGVQMAMILTEFRAMRTVEQVRQNERTFLRTKVQRLRRHAIAARMGVGDDYMTRLLEERGGIDISNLPTQFLLYESKLSEDDWFGKFAPTYERRDGE